jgi:hypothetical protein
MGPWFIAALVSFGSMSTTTNNGSLFTLSGPNEFSSKANDFVSYVCGSWTGWQLLLAVLLVLVAYDQGMMLLSGL